MDKFARMALLYDFYSPLLTVKQRDVLDLYYQKDYSLVEIAEASAISRQAVYDLLKRTEHILVDYENKLNLVERYLARQTKLLQIKQALSGLTPQDFPGLSVVIDQINTLLATD